MKRTHLSIPLRLHLTGLALALLTLFLSHPALAGSLRWGAAGGGGTGTWDVNTTANWFDGATATKWPAAGGLDDDAVFGGTAGVVTLATAGVTANDLTFNTANYAISNQVLTLNGSTPTVSNSVAATINSIIAGTNGLVKKGAGALRLTATNSYSGGTVIEAGVLELSRVGSVGGTVFGTGTITLGASSGANAATITAINSTIPACTNDILVVAGSAGAKTLVANSTVTMTYQSGTITLATNLTIGGNGSVALNSAITGSGFGLIKTGAGSLVLRGQKAFTGTMEVQAGTVTIGAGYNDLLTNTATLKISGGTYALGANNQIIAGVQMLGGLLSGTGTLTNTTDFDMQAGTNTAILAGAVGLNKSGAGRFNLGDATYTGPTTVSNGILNVVGNITSPITVKAGGALDGTGSTTESVTFGPGVSTFYYDVNAGDWLIASNFNATAGTVVVVGKTAGDGIVFECNTQDGITGTPGVNYVSGTRGTLSIGGAMNSQLLFAGSPAVTLKWKGNAANPTFWDVVLTTNWTQSGSVDRFYSGDTVIFDDSASSFAVSIQPASLTPAAVTFSNNLNAYTLSGGAIGGTGAVTKDGTNTVTVLSGSHSFSGGLVVNAGTLSLLGATNTFAGGITNNGGRLVFTNLNQLGSLTPAIVMNGGTLSYAGGGFVSDSLKLAFDASGGGVELATSPGATLRVGGKVTGTGDWTKSGAGILALGQNNSSGPGNDFTGKLTVSGGMVDIRHANSLGTTDGLTELHGSTLLIQNFGQTDGSTVTVAEPLVFSGTSYLEALNQESKTYTDEFSGPITNLTGATLGISTAISTAAAVLTLNLNGDIYTGTNSLLAFGRTGSFPVAVLNSNQTITVNGAIHGPGSVSAEGAAGSVYTLANNNYTGNTTVTGGTLGLGQANLDTNSTVTVDSGAVLRLDFPVTNTIRSLVLNGVAQQPGVYDSTNGAPNIAGSGSLLVTFSPLANYATNITAVADGGKLNISWPATHLGWILQVQTNGLGTGLATNWVDVAGSASVITNQSAINPANPAVFYRLRHP